MWVFGAGKTLCEILTVADAMSLPIAGPRVDQDLPRRGSVRPSLQRGGNRKRSRLPRRDCRVARVMARLIQQRKRRSKCRMRPCLSAPGLPGNMTPGEAADIHIESDNKWKTIIQAAVKSIR